MSYTLKSNFRKLFTDLTTLQHIDSQLQFNKESKPKIYLFIFLFTVKVVFVCDSVFIHVDYREKEQYICFLQNQNISCLISLKSVQFLILVWVRFFIDRHLIVNKIFIKTEDKHSQKIYRHIYNSISIPQSKYEVAIKLSLIADYSLFTV